MEFIAISYLVVSNNAADRVFDDVKEVPHNKVGLLLATSPIIRSGAHNYHFDNRIKAADELYKAGKIDCIIASGGNYTNTQKNGCDEPQAIRDSLIARGVPSDRIILDYEGTRTLNSIAKAKEVYGLDSLTLISQKYHNERAIYLADKYGLHAVGYNAQPSPIRSSRVKNTFRECFARVRMFIDLITGRQPEIKQEPIDLSYIFTPEKRIFWGEAVKGHIEKDTIVGNFTGVGIDTLYVYTKFDENAENMEDRVKYYARSNNPALPQIELYGSITPSLVYEGDVDGDGKDEWGYLHTGTMSQWRQYRIYNYDAGRKRWRHLFYNLNHSRLLDTNEHLRGSGLEIVEKGPRPGLIKINYDSWWPDYELRDTIVKPTYTPISKKAW